MFCRKPIRIALVLLFLLGTASFGNALFAQYSSPALIQKERERQADELGKRNREPLKTARTEIEAANAAAAEYREKMTKAQFAQFRAAFVQFLEARGELSVALGRKATLKDPARKMEKSIAVFVDHIGRLVSQRPRPVSVEIKNMTPAELGRTVLAEAQRLSPDLLSVIESESSPTLEVRFLMSLPNLQAELMRLQSMTRKLK
jgi:hypothetical protein